MISRAPRPPQQLLVSDGIQGSSHSPASVFCCSLLGMSSQLQSNRPAWASRTAFDGLGVESGEESEDEVVEEPVQPSESGSDARPSKSALKKAKAAARLERQQQRKAAARASKAQSADSLDGENEGVESPSHTAPEKGEDFDVHPPLPKEKPSELVQMEDVTDHSPSPLLSTSVSNGRPPELNNTKIVDEKSNSLATDPPRANGVGLKTANGDVGGALEKQEATQGGEQVKKRQNMLTRTLWTFIMIGGFITLLLMGHGYMVVLVMICQTLVYREVTALFSLKKKDVGEPDSRGRDPWSKTLNWYFFAITNYFLYGESIIYYFKHVVFADAQLTLFATNHRIISFTLYTIGFVGFVLSLKRGYLKQQFGLFCWVHMTLLLVVVSSHFIVNNILEGMIWFWVPASLVICNDVFAYIWGITLGRTPLIKLSPKKTVEGFVGAFFSTVLFGVLWGTYFMRFDYMICPVHNLGVSAWSDVGNCDPNPVFVWRDWEIPTPMRVFLGPLLGREMTTIPYAPYQYHLLFMACFASLVAPFGGFFASGFKRAFNIKDFGHSIPGHGGMTDRMDCQFLMGVFTYVYYSSLIRQHHVSVGSLLQMIVSGLTPAEQLELMADLKRYLEGQGISVNI